MPWELMTVDAILGCGVTVVHKDDMVSQSRDSGAGVIKTFDYIRKSCSRSGKTIVV